MGPVACFFGTLSLAATLVLIDWGVLGYAGFGPESMAGVEIGTFLGLVCLAIPIFCFSPDPIRFLN